MNSNQNSYNTPTMDAPQDHLSSLARLRKKLRWNSIWTLAILALGAFLLTFDHIQIYEHEIIDATLEKTLENNPTLRKTLKKEYADAAHKSLWIEVERIINAISIFLLGAIVLDLVFRNIKIDQEKEAISKLKEEFYDTTLLALDKIISARHIHGLESIIPTINYKEHIFDNLEQGDELLWLDTAPPKDALTSGDEMIKQAIDRGASIKMLIMDVGNPSLDLRTLEIKSWGPYSDYANIKNYAKSLKLFLSSIAALQDKLDSSKKHNLQYRTYLDLPGIPLYLLKKKNGVLIAYTGYYLTKASICFVHLKWVGSWMDENQTSIAHDFMKYFVNKWENCYTQRIPHIQGEWIYTMTAEDGHEWWGKGKCMIEQQGNGRILHFSGERTEDSGGALQKSIEWNSTWGEICRAGWSVTKSNQKKLNCGIWDDVQSIRFEYEIEEEGSNIKRRGICRLDSLESDNTCVARMIGKYYLPNIGKEDGAFRSFFGRIEFTRI